MTVLSCTNCGATRTISWKPKNEVVMGGVCACGSDTWKVER